MKKILVLLFPFFNTVHAAPPAYDICVYGGTSAGVIAAYTAKMLGKSVLLIEPGKHVGGLSAGGLGYTDIGNKYAVTGLGLNFYRRTGSYYGKFESWIFEPHVAENIFLQYLRSANVPVLYENRLTAVKKEKGFIKEITVEYNGNPHTNTLIRAKLFIDCSYEGDLMAKAGVSYVVGREANSVYRETFNGVQVKESQTPQRGNQIPDGIDPYKIPGDSTSGLLWGISNASLPPTGSGDNKVQAYNFRICLTNDPANRIPITRPARYDSTKYELLLRYISKLPNASVRDFMKFDRMPNHKTDINNNGGFSTDMIGMNYDYPDGDANTRRQIIQAHEDYDKGLLYFLSQDPRVPASMHQFMAEWGYPADEYPDNGHWSPQLYIREARRMTGEYIMTQANCQGKTTVNDGIAMAAYGMDSHNTQRLVINGMAKNEGDVQRGVAGPYPISYRAITPKARDCKNLLVPVCLSASHIAYGSIRMEPVFMVLAQSAATAAVVAINGNKAVQDIPVDKVQQMLKDNPLADGSTPEILVDNADSTHVVKTGAWQLQKGEHYGPDAYINRAGSDGAAATVRFIPQVKEPGDYQVYTYVSAREKGISAKTSITVFNGTASEVQLETAGIAVQGQTGGEWLPLGTYQFREGTGGYVEFSNKGANGAIVADAVVFVPVSGNKK
ncbi:FAD dependent oxidoreductase [Chitinophaga ginsengisegetis]|uniref:FAD dependent oxidoreductase n=1 Tax=Chitinophaga ginsengisegetis TaxID=393003 RepID=A0A1T5PA03_9BACT|nr:FAD-dependent oxidoreductase [Chitinophaga ginsengisegetis]SKD09079.1 FAD dependent oxidoreductase [Chitinophaga ginsengisegetis]